MSYTTGFFESFYAGVWQQPILLWLLNALGTALALISIARIDGLQSFQGLRRFVIAWAIISVVDAWLTANEVLGLGMLTGFWASALPIFFVVAGDLRVFWAAERWGSGSAKTAVSRLRSASRIVGFSLVVPVLMHLLGVDKKDPRILFLVYELCFLLWVAVYFKSPIRTRGDTGREAF